MAGIHSISIHDILFMCTGNICRSPFAEASFRAKLFKNDFTDVRVSSAGTIGGQIPYCPQEAIIAAESFGIDLSYHRSRQLTEASLLEANLVIGMEDSHRRFIEKRWGKLSYKFRPLSDFDRADRQGKDIPDPYGLSIDYYQVIYKQIDEALDGLILWMKGARE